MRKYGSYCFLNARLVIRVENTTTTTWVCTLKKCGYSKTKIVSWLGVYLCSDQARMCRVRFSGIEEFLKVSSNSRTFYSRWNLYPDEFNACRFNSSNCYVRKTTYQVCKYEMRISDDRWCTRAICVVTIWHCSSLLCHQRVSETHEW